MDNLVLLKEFRGHYWQMTTAQGWAAWVFGWKHDSHQYRAVTPPERQKEMAAQIYRVFWLRFTVGGSRMESFIFIYVKVWNARKCFQPIRHSSMSNMFEIFCDTHRHTEANHTFFSYLVFSNTCTFILYMMEVSGRFLQNFCNYLYNCSAFIQLVYYYSWLLQIMLAKLDFIYFLLIMEAIQVNINQKQP